jgi:hypothetical protein
MVIVLDRQELIKVDERIRVGRKTIYALLGPGLHARQPPFDIFKLDIPGPEQDQDK